MHRTSRTATRRSLALTTAGATVAAVTLLLPGSAGAATTPTITTTSPTVVLGGAITINGTGCEPSGDAIVNLLTGFGTPSESVVGTDYPISTDVNGSFSSTWTLPSNLGLPDGTVITLVGQCPFTQTGASFTPITVTVGSAVTTTSAPSTTAAPPTTAAVTTAPTTAPPATAAPATALVVRPTYTG